jgi:hypothetical protein
MHPELIFLCTKSDAAVALGNRLDRGFKMKLSLSELRIEGEIYDSQCTTRGAACKLADGTKCLREK